jgi:hypothetical protein
VVDGQTTALAGPVEFTVRNLDRGTFSAKGPAATEKFAYQRRAQDLQRAVTGAVRIADEAQSRLSHIRKAIMDTPGLKDDLLADAETLRLAIDKVQVSLRGDPTLGKRVEPELPSIGDRVGTATDSTFDNTSPPTKTQQEQLEVASQEFEKVLADLKRLVDEDLRALEGKLESAGAPYTPGRMPDWKRP